MSDDQPAEPAEPQESPERVRAAARLRPAALLLTTVSMMNLLAGGYLLMNAVFAKWHGSNADWQEKWNSFKPEEKAALAQWGWNTADDAFLGVANGTLFYGGAAALVSLLTLAGARSMLLLRSYRFAMTSAILTALPCLTPCCVLGQIAGVWAFVLLMQPDIRSVFE